MTGYWSKDKTSIAAQQIHLIIHTFQALEQWLQEIPSQNHHAQREDKSLAGASKNISPWYNDRLQKEGYAEDLNTKSENKYIYSQILYKPDRYLNYFFR